MMFVDITIQQKSDSDKGANSGLIRLLTKQISSLAAM